MLSFEKKNSVEKYNIRQIQENLKSESPLILWGGSAG